MLFHRPTGLPARWLTQLLAAGFGWLAVDAALRAQQSVVHWDWLAGVGLRPGPLYLLLSALLMAALGIIGLWAVLRQGRLAGVTAATVGMIASVFYWIDRLLVAQSPGRLTGAPFSAVVNALGLALLLAWAFTLNRRTHANPRAGDRG